MFISVWRWSMWRHWSRLQVKSLQWNVKSSIKEKRWTSQTKRNLQVCNHNYVQPFSRTPTCDGQTQTDRYKAIANTASCSKTWVCEHYVTLPRIVQKLLVRQVLNKSKWWSYEKTHRHARGASRTLVSCHETPLPTYAQISQCWIYSALEILVINVTASKDTGKRKLRSDGDQWVKKHRRIQCTVSRGYDQIDNVVFPRDAMHPRY